MDILAYRDYCLSLKGTSESFPFDESTLVFKVLDKMFVLTDIDTFESVNLKCDPAGAIELREAYPDHVLPGYHMNKKHWNTVMIRGPITDEQLKQWTFNSYRLVVEKMPLKQQKKLENL